MAANRLVDSRVLWPTAVNSHSRTEVLATVADYANAAAWTPAVRTAIKISPPGPLAAGTSFAQVIDVGGSSAEFVWKIKKFEPPLRVVLKGKAKVDMHQWFWPGRVKGASGTCCALCAPPTKHAMRPVKVEDRYFIQEGPTADSVLVEFYGHTKVMGFGKILAPLFKSQWREIKNGAREGLARVQGRPAEGAAGAKLSTTHELLATPARGPSTAV